MMTMTNFVRVLAFIASGWICVTQALADINPVPAQQCARMDRAGLISAQSPITCDRLRVVSFSYWEFGGQANFLGEVMVLDALSVHVQALFDDLYERGFPLGSAVLPQNCLNRDLAAACNNNTFAFNGRRPVDAVSWSGHAYGTAIDINPLQNPSISISDSGQVRLRPLESGQQPLNRLKYRPARVTRTGLAEEVVDLFARHGFINWGGYRDSLVGYQHFSIGSKAFMQSVASLAPEEAQRRIDRHVSDYRECMTESTLAPRDAARKDCVEKAMAQASPERFTRAAQ